MDYLFIKPSGGLANRIRVMEAAYNFAENHQAKMVVIWEKNGALNASFHECFSLIKDAKIIETNYYGSSVLSKVKRSVLTTVENLGQAVLAKKTVLDTEIEPVLTNERATGDTQAFFDGLAQQYKSLFVETCFGFYPNTREFRLVVREDIKQASEKLLAHHHSVIGIHIRRTDNVDSIRHSPMEKFIEEIRRNLQCSPSTFFYLSTDSEEVVEELRTLFRERIITGVSVRNRDSKEGILAALTDMCCLSQCQKILGSFRSSFSERAAIMGNIPLQIVTA